MRERTGFFCDTERVHESLRCCAAVALALILLLAGSSGGAFAFNQEGSTSLADSVTPDELIAMLNETKQAIQEVSVKIEENLSRQKALDQDANNLTYRYNQVLTPRKKVLDQEAIALGKEFDDLLISEASIDAERQSVDSLCTGTYSNEQYDAAVARCDAVLGPFNTRVDTFNRRKKAFLEKSDNWTLRYEEYRRDLNQYKLDREKWQKADAENRAEYKEIYAESEELKVMEAALNEQLNKCRADGACRCSNPALNDEEASQCSQPFFDGGRSERELADLPDEPSTGTPFFGEGDSRTPDEAIEEYRNSGSQYPNQLPRPSDAPPPPKPQKDDDK